jgi:hypothetical protein
MPRSAIKTQVMIPSLSSRSHIISVIFLSALLSASSANCQNGTIQPGQVANRNNPPEVEQKRIFGIIPNYRTSPSLQEYKPLTPRQKFKLASQDAFDRGTFLLAAAFAGEAQLTNANRSFGQGAGAYGLYFVTSYADFSIGDFMTEAIFPTFLHQDPRYFRQGHGSTMSRLGYSIGQIFWTHTDAGGTALNTSELAGNATAVLISNAYYTGNRDASDAVAKWGTQLGVDMASNILKEFSPDIYRIFSRKHRSPNP